ncbi:rRNA maturation RNase YbeY [Terrihabitans rhizophilus]|uniref:Endoribonuclease YbeY n=1 Tax=Terrihabitans rhizophilus TaxID=3092662 RepID=A0ABU4RRM0_9HYPH|nr:rRNA maturation RNase YbeY [Terrihabitans sp. PJ23]MDX6807503.1 rRNA maturation RNase YbeY [Terrihabitans sp. PJ23]
MSPDGPQPVVEVQAESALWEALPGVEAAAEAAVFAALKAANLTCRPDAELSVMLADDARVRELNRDWRGKDNATNVLSFPGAEDEDVEDAVLLGDVVLAYETVAREAEAEDKSLRDHFTHLVVHGTLHLFGFDHLTAEEAEEMESIERQALAGLGIADPYSETSPA